MIDELAELIQTFPGDCRRIHCFLHILNLVAKTLIRQFDLPKGQVDVALDEAKKELLSLGEELYLEEQLTVLALNLNDDENDDNDKGWEDEWATMSPVERAELDTSVRPIRLVLVKVNTIIQ
jgi:hypothetical protein